MRERKKRPSARGKRALFMAVAELILLGVMLVMSALSGGRTHPVFGGIGIGLIFCSAVSFVLGKRGLREKNATYGQCRGAMAISLILMLFLIMLFVRGSR